MPDLTHTDKTEIPEGYTDTDIALTPRILSGALMGRNVFGVNWTAKFAHVPEDDVPPAAMRPVLTGDLGAGDDILAYLLPPSVLGDMTEREAIDGIRDGRWPTDLLDKVTHELEDPDMIEEVYERCISLMMDADKNTFYWDANYIVHTLAVENLDDASVRSAVTFYERFAESDSAGSLFALFLLSLLGPKHFDTLIKTLKEIFDAR
jgi:hypothetical protein